MERDEAITNRFDNHYTAYHLTKPVKYLEQEFTPIIVVDESNYKLITIFENAEDMEKIIADELRKTIIQEQNASAFTNPRSQRSPRFQSGGGIGEQRGENKRILFTLN